MKQQKRVQLNLQEILAKNYTKGQDALPDEKTERVGTGLEKTTEMRYGSNFQ